MRDAERFEPYTSAFKRRAVSPSTSSASLSPLLTQANLANLPNPLHSNLPSLDPANGAYSAQYSSNLNMLPPSSLPPSPNIGSGSRYARSRASSPAPSISSSAGTTRRCVNLHADEETKGNRQVDLGKMSLG